MNSQTSSAQLITSTLSLRRSHPSAPPEDLLALVFSNHRAEDMREAVQQSAASQTFIQFAELVTEALDECMSPAEWRGLVEHASDANIRGRLLDAWRDTVGDLLVRRFSVAEEWQNRPGFRGRRCLVA